MSDKFESLDALESTLYRCRALVGRIGQELRKKKPDHFVDERSLEDLHASLEHAAWVLEQNSERAKKRSRRRPGASLALYAAALVFDLLI